MALAHFSSSGVDIAFLDGGEGDPILLIHGFASNHVVNWGATGWIDTLKRDGRRVIAMDVRGHGRSAKLRDPEAYPLALLADDAARQAFQESFTAGADTSPGSQIIGSSPVLIEECEIVSVAEGADGFLAAARFSTEENA